MPENGSFEQTLEFVDSEINLILEETRTSDRDYNSLINVFNKFQRLPASAWQGNSRLRVFTQIDTALALSERFLGFDLTAKEPLFSLIEKHIPDILGAISDTDTNQNIKALKLIDRLTEMNFLPTEIRAIQILFDNLHILKQGMEIPQYARDCLAITKSILKSTNESYKITTLETIYSVISNTNPTTAGSLFSEVCIFDAEINDDLKKLREALISNFGIPPDDIIFVWGKNHSGLGRASQENFKAMRTLEDDYPGIVKTLYESPFRIRNFGIFPQWLLIKQYHELTGKTLPSDNRGVIVFSTIDETDLQNKWMTDLARKVGKNKPFYIFELSNRFQAMKSIIKFTDLFPGFSANLVAGVGHGNATDKRVCIDCADEDLGKFGVIHLDGEWVQYMQDNLIESEAPFIVFACEQGTENGLASGLSVKFPGHRVFACEDEVDDLVFTVPTDKNLRKIKVDFFENNHQRRTMIYLDGDRVQN